MLLAREAVASWGRGLLCHAVLCHALLCHALLCLAWRFCERPRREGLEGRAKGAMRTIAQASAGTGEVLDKNV